MITTVEELEHEVFRRMRNDFSSPSELQNALGIKQSSARNYFNGLVDTIDKENLFRIADVLNVPYSITNRR